MHVRPMALSPLQLHVGLFGPPLTVGWSPTSAFRRKQELQPGFQALSHIAGVVWCGKSRASFGEEGMPPEELQDFIRQEFFSDPTDWWDNRRSKPSLWHPDFKHNQFMVTLWLNNSHNPAWGDLQLATWDPGTNRPPESATLVTADAVDALDLLVQRGCHVPSNLLYGVLKKCIAHKDLVLGRRIHALIVDSGCEGDAFLANHLIGLYASHGRLEEAMQVLSKVSSPNAYNWAAIIFAYSRHGEAPQAIQLYKQMRESTVKPDNRIFVAVLKACATAGDLVAGQEVHAHILASPEKPDIFVQTGLLSMYAKCGSLEDARRVFDGLPDRNAVTWTAMIAGYAQQGMGQEALSLYRCMQQQGHSPPDSVTFVCLLQACARIGIGALHEGKQLHTQIERRGLQHDLAVGGSLVNMYAKCGSVVNARSVFDSLPVRNVVTWTAMISGYAQQGMGQEALSLYNGMQQDILSSLGAVTFVCLLQACASVGVGALHQGKQLHAQIEERGLQHDVVLGGSLVNMYAKCGSLENARSIFDSLPDRNIVAWTAMIAGYAQQGMGQEALSLHNEMQREGLTPPDAVTYTCLLQACASVGIEALHEGKRLHAQIEERGLQKDVVLSGSLVNMYVKFGRLEDARSTFDRLPDRNIVTWNAMLTGYAQQGMGQEALSLYRSMQQEGLYRPNSVTFICLVQACASVGVGALHDGKLLHAKIEEHGLQDDVVLGSSLVNMYAKCGSVEDARSMFDRLPDRNVVTWTAMIAGYAHQGMAQEALSLYSTMQQEGLSLPDSVTFVCLLQACGIVAGLPLGKQLHVEIEERGMLANVGVGPALVNMYAKCGSMFDSRNVFDSLAERTIEAWNALIGGYTRQGDGEVVFDLLARMSLEGIEPNGVTFLSVLTVCSHVGLVDEGRKYFQVMSTDYGISPTVEHYTCMMDLLGRAGHLDEALQMAKTMPVPSDGAVWYTLLSACRMWNNVEIGRQAFEFAVSLDAKDAASYVLMSNIYARAEMWEDAKEMQARRVKCGAWKEPGQCWWTDMGGVVHTFGVGDKNHPESEGIYARLEQLVPRKTNEGYVPYFDVSLQEGLQKEKTAELCV